MQALSASTSYILHSYIELASLFFSLVCLLQLKQFSWLGYFPKLCVTACLEQPTQGNMLHIPLEISAHTRHIRHKSHTSLNKPGNNHISSQVHFDYIKYFSWSHSS